MAIQVRLAGSGPFWRVAWRFLAVAVAAIAACAPDPDVEDVLGPAGTAGHFKVVGPPAPLSRTQSRMILDRLQRDTKDPSNLDRQLALQAALSDNPLIGGNKVTLLRDGEETFPAMFRAIRGARHHINLEYEADESDSSAPSAAPMAARMVANSKQANDAEDRVRRVEERLLSVDDGLIRGEPLPAYDRDEEEDDAP